MYSQTSHQRYFYIQVRRGATVPDKYFLTGSKMIEDESKVIHVKVKGGAKEEVEVQVKQRGEVLK